MDKIVEFFDTETGQVHKDRQGKLKIKLAVHWPVTAGLSGGEEYRSFSKWAKHSNKYHLEVRDLTCQLKGYHQLRYQSTPYDEGVTSEIIFP